MSKLETNTIDTVSGTTNLTIGSTNSTTVTFENGSPTGHMYPAFEASVSANQTITSSTWTVAACDTEEYDTDSCYDNSTYKFTPTVAGKYLVYGFIYGQCSTADNLVRVIMALSKNGSRTVNTTIETNSSSKSNVLTTNALLFMI